MNNALWTYRCTIKTINKATPFQLVYGLEGILSIEVELSSLRIAISKHLRDVHSLKKRIATLEQLDEIRGQAFLNMEAIQRHKKTYYDSKLQTNVLKTNVLVLLYDSRF